MNTVTSIVAAAASQEQHDIVVAPTAADKGKAPAAKTGKKRKARKAITPRSLVWQQFDRFVTEDGAIKGKCKFCQLEVGCDPKAHGTSGLKSHMKTCTQIPHTSDTKQTEIDVCVHDGGSKAVGSWRFDQDACKKALGQMIIEDELPFSFVERPGFRKFMAVAQTRFKVPSRSTISRVCYQLYLDEKKKLIKFLATDCQRVCITTDTWTSIQKINYMTVTAHFIDNDWNLNKKILNFCPISSHKGTALGRALEVCLVEWGIDKVFTITVDNASSNTGAVKHIKKKMLQWGTSILGGEFVHVRCIAHILNLMVQDGLKTLGKSLSKIREAVRYVRQSPSRLEKFKLCAEKEKIDTNSLLCLDVCTRWNSTYLMLDTACRFEKAFDSYVHVDPFYKIELQKRVSKKDGLDDEIGSDEEDENGLDLGAVGGDGIPNEEDWVNARRLCKLLKYFYDLTCFVSGSLYVTSNAYFEEITNVACLLKKWRNSHDFELSLLADAMFAKFNKYWGDVSKFNSLFYIAEALDPRNKIEFVELALTDLHDEIIGESLGKKVREDMKRLYAAYCEIYGPKNKTKELIGKPSNDRDVTFHSEEGDEMKNDRKLRFKRLRLEAGAFRNRSELDLYLHEDVVQDEEGFSILEWWKNHSPRYPILSRMARDVLAVPVSTVASESAFSTGGRVLDSFRSSLTPRVVQSLICAQDWFRRSKEAFKIEENIAELDKWEADYAELENESTVTEL